MLRTRGRFRGGGASARALLLVVWGQSNAARRASKVTTTYPDSLYTFTGLNETTDRGDGATATAPFASSVYSGIQAFTEFSKDMESIAPGYAYVATQYRHILTQTVAIGARHWRELMPGTGSWANMAQTMLNGITSLAALGYSKSRIDVRIIVDEGEADSDTTGPGSVAEGATITASEALNIFEQIASKAQKWVKWCFNDATKTCIVAAYGTCLTGGAGYVVVQNAQLAAAQGSSGFRLLGPRYGNEFPYETDGTHVGSSGKRAMGEYAAMRIADMENSRYLPTYISSLTRSGATLTATVETPDGSDVVIDTTHCPETTTSFASSKYGLEAFKVSDGTQVAVSNVTANARTLTITLASDPGGAVVLRCGQMTWPGGNQSVSGTSSKLARTNIRGSRSTTLLYDGATPMYDWLIQHSVTSN